jgi:hypothetical protein
MTGTRGASKGTERKEVQTRGVVLKELGGKEYHNK